MMREWNPNALADLTERGQVRVWVDANRSAYFMLLPAKEGSEIPRSKVNIHQLASYTAELYTRIDASDQKVLEQSNLIASQNMLIETQSKQMEEMRQRMEAMDEQMKALSLSVSYMDNFLISRFAQANRQPEEGEMIEIVIE
jgi:5-methylcytosine-specific restriction endonuclease McrBC regulatory subunit McrC